eukprot:Trichotokara_eunicae@DN6309_c0_g1_i6.p1
MSAALEQKKELFKISAKFELSFQIDPILPYKHPSFCWHKSTSSVCTTSTSLASPFSRESQAQGKKTPEHLGQGRTSAPRCGDPPTLTFTFSILLDRRATRVNTKLLHTGS